MASFSAGGKGSSRRPSQVPQKQIDENWELAFGKKDHSKDGCKNCSECKCGKKENKS